MWYDGAPHQGQCEGCTWTAWHLDDAAVYLNARGVSFAVVTTGRWPEVEAFVGEWTHTGDKYIRVTVILASVLFIVGISSHFPLRGVRIGLVTVGAALLVLAAVELLQLPGPPT